MAHTNVAFYVKITLIKERGAMFFSRSSIEHATPSQFSETNRGKSHMIIDKLYESVSLKGPVCVGLDTDLSYIPEELIDKFDSDSERLFAFNKAIIDSTLDVRAVYKVQIAYYESLGLEGLKAYSKTLKYIKEAGALSIADVKRGDIAKTAEMYAAAHFSGDFEADFMTISPYMGLDTLEPYFDFIKDREKGLFVLVRTSNPGSNDFEYLETSDGDKVYEIVGRGVQQVGEQFTGQCGYSSIGAVMGCTHSDEVEKMRALLKTTFFLIPGYGAQGGKAEDVARYMKDGNGGIVNSSRGILLAYRKQFKDMPFYEAARAEVVRMRDEILEAVKGNGM